MSNDYSTAHEQVKRQLHVITFKTGDLIARSRPILSSLINQLFLLIPTKIAANMQSRFLQRRDLSNWLVVFAASNDACTFKSRGGSAPGVSYVRRCWNALRQPLAPPQIPIRVSVIFTILCAATGLSWDDSLISLALLAWKIVLNPSFLTFSYHRKIKIKVN